MEKSTYLSNETIIEFFEQLAEQRGLIETNCNKWKFKEDSYEDLCDSPYYYKLTPLGFQPINPIGFTKNSKIDNTLKPKAIILGMAIGFLFGILTMLILS